MLRTDAHASELFSGPTAEQAFTALLEFIARVTAA